MLSNLKSPSLCVLFMVFCCILHCCVAFFFCDLRCFVAKSVCRDLRAIVWRSDVFVMMILMRGVLTGTKRGVLTDTSDDDAHVWYFD